MEKKGQVTIFIIIAIVIVALGVTAYFLFPKLQSALGRGVTNPEEFIQTCLEEEIEDAVELVSLHGGSIEPEHYVMQDNEKIEYLCYTGEYLKLCTIQRPLLKQHIEEEIRDEVKPKVEACFEALKTSYVRRGYEEENIDLQIGLVPIKVELRPQGVVTTLDYSLTLTKEDTERYDSFTVILDNNLYELVMIANNIIEWESTQGTAEPTMYMVLDIYLKVERDWPGNTKIYILTNKNAGNKFQFASRSLVYPEGYII